MGYHIKKVSSKKSAPLWKVQFVSFKKKDFHNPQAKDPKKIWDISKTEWSALGFQAWMTFEEASARKRQLNAESKFLREAEARIKLVEENKSFELLVDACLPDFFREEFERRFVFGRMRSPYSRKTLSQWKAAQNCILALRKDPSLWFEEHLQFYDYFTSKKLSLSYIGKILRFINLWGFFCSRKFGKPFLPIPNPRGYERARLLDAYFEKLNGKKADSEPLTFEKLKKIKNKINSENYNWLFLSVWLGLRPKEIDLLLEKQNFRVEQITSGIKILWVYQSKLISKPQPLRWKGIPLLYLEQRRTLNILKQKNFIRPLRKTIKSHFGNDTTLYGGRKGFTDLMLSRGQALENIARKCSVKYMYR